MMPIHPPVIILLFLCQQVNYSVNKLSCLYVVECVKLSTVKVHEHVSSVAGNIHLLPNNNVDTKLMG